MESNENSSSKLVKGKKKWVKTKPVIMANRIHRDTYAWHC